MNREDFFKKIDAKEREWQEQIDNLKLKAMGFDDVTRIKLEENIENLNRKLKVIELHTNEFKKQSSDSWNDLSDSIAQAWSELVANIDNALLKLKK